MSHHHVYVFMALALRLFLSAAEGTFGPGEAAARRASRVAGDTVDFKVAVWYRKRDPIASFKYEIYDVRKGQYTPKVEEWLKEVQTKYPGYFVAVRDVDLKREKGDTEFLKVGSVIDRDLVVAAASAGIVLGSGRAAPLSQFTGFGQGPRSSDLNRKPALNRSPLSNSLDRSFLTPAPSMFPVPVPIPNRPR